MMMTNNDILVDSQAQMAGNEQNIIDPAVRLELLDAAKTLGLNLSGPKALHKLELMMAMAMTKQKQIDNEQKQKELQPDTWSTIIWSNAQAFIGKLL